MIKVQSQNTSCPSSVSQAAALGALTDAQRYPAKWCREYQRRRDIYSTQINEIPGLRSNLPEGAFYLFVDCSELIGRILPSGSRVASDTDFTNYLLEEAGVAVTPGSAFDTSPYFRMSLADESSRLAEAVERIGDAVERMLANIE